MEGRQEEKATDLASMWYLQFAETVPLLSQVKSIPGRELNKVEGGGEIE